MPVSVTKKSRVFKVASETPVVAVDLTAPDLVAPVTAVPVNAEPVTAVPVTAAASEPVDFDAEVASLEPSVTAEPEMWRGIELEPVKTNMPPLESEEEDISDSDMPPLCAAKCTDCDCSALKNNKGLTINAMIEKAIENHLSPEESDADADDADANNADAENEEESDFKSIRPRTISDSVKETLEEHLNPKVPPSRPDYTLIIVAITLAIGLWHLYVSVNTGVNTLNEF